MNRELPPRARRIRQVRFRNIPNDGTTSACAENTHRNKIRYQPTGNYLRVRGEYIPQIQAGKTHPELPPRARRILPMPICDGVGGGTTSACAENTADFHARNALALELPPRARRIPYLSGWRIFPAGTTSACAENTFCVASVGSPKRNYLRVRGEYHTPRVGGGVHPELPPRARRIP